MIYYHMHSYYSLLDSCTDPQDYVDLAVQNGCKALAISEHGMPKEWTATWDACRKAGIRYIHAVEIYLTEQLEPKVRDNYHTVLLAKNMDGLLELNALVSKSTQEDHFYYTNRISFDEFLNLSDNIITTSACLASPLHRLDENHPYYERLVQKYDFLEIQPHNHPDQIAFNKRLYDLSQRYNKRLIVGTDTHSSSKYKQECRAVLLKAKGKNYGDEDAFDLSFKTYDELVEMFKAQNAIPIDECIKALNNTDLLYDMTEDINLNLDIKYPILYGSKDEDERRFKELVYEQLEQKIKDGIIDPDDEQRYRDAFEEEFDVFKQLDMFGFMLAQSEIVMWCKENNIATGPGRGSVGGSRTAFVSNITEVDAEKYGTVFSRFANPNRVEIGDIDIDVIESDRPQIFKYVTERFGTEKTARVASFGTLKDKAVIDEIGRALAEEWKEKFGDTPDNPYSLSNIAKIKKSFEEDPEATRLANKTLFYFFDGLLNCKVSQSVHAAGMVISPITLPDHYGVFNKNGESCLMLSMDSVHDQTGIAKYDFLVLKTLKVIKDTCKYAGIKYPHVWELDLDDQNVWEDMQKNLQCIFQFEGAFAADCFKKFKPVSIEDMALVTACIRPAGASYRDELLQRIPNKNPSELLDKLLEKNLGYLVYQEDTIRFLQDICGFSGGDADTIRRGIGRKRKEILDEAMPKILEGYCSKSDKCREEAEAEAREFMQIIEDSANYQFNYSHAIAYCIISYMCGYFRYYYPIEFLTSYLNNAANDSDIQIGTDCAKRLGIRITMPKWGYSKDDYYFDKDAKIIAKGLASIKHMSKKSTDSLYNLAHSHNYGRYIDILRDLSAGSILDVQQLDILIKLDFFSNYGNQREILFITDIFYNLLKKGEAKQLKRDKVDGSILEELIRANSTDTNKDGKPSASYKITNMDAILDGLEDVVKAQHLPDLSLIDKVKNFEEATGYLGYTTGREEDRRKLFITEIKPLYRKKDKKQFGYSFYTTSIGSGVEARFTVFNRMYNLCPANKGDIIYCQRFARDGPYFILNEYSKIQGGIA